WRTYSSNSTKLPVSTSISMRSRAVILPLACCFCWAIFSGSTTASSNRARRSAILAAVVERSGVSVTDSTLSSGAAEALDDVHNGFRIPLAGVAVCGAKRQQSGVLGAGQRCTSVSGSLGDGAICSGGSRPRTRSDGGVGGDVYPGDPVVFADFDARRRVRLRRVRCGGQLVVTLLLARHLFGVRGTRGLRVGH